MYEFVVYDELLKKTVFGGTWEECIDYVKSCHATEYLNIFMCIPIKKETLQREMAKEGELPNYYK